MRITNRHAAEAQLALNHLMAVDLPVRASFDLALLANAIGNQVLAFSKVRDNLIKNYKIKLSIGNEKGSVMFSVAGNDDEKLKEEALKEFVAKVNELMLTLGDHITANKVILPGNISIKPEILKPLTPWLEVADVG